MNFVCLDVGCIRGNRLFRWYGVLFLICLGFSSVVGGWGFMLCYVLV